MFQIMFDCCPFFKACIFKILEKLFEPKKIILNGKHDIRGLKGLNLIGDLKIVIYATCCKMMIFSAHSSNEGCRGGKATKILFNKP